MEKRGRRRDKKGGTISGSRRRQALAFYTYEYIVILAVVDYYKDIRVEIP